ncbi:MAG: hypothetical protein R3B47_20830 [Bacteroidia bacterium]
MFWLRFPEPAADAELVISDLLGKKLFSVLLKGKKELEVDVSNLEVGSYQVQVRNAKNYWSRLLIITR